VKRLIALAAVATAVVFVAVPAATSGTKDYKGPACNNITNGDGSYFTSTTGVPTVDFTVQYGDALCSGTTYAFYVTDTSGNALGSSNSGDSAACTPETSGGSCVDFVVALSSGPGTVCVYATTEKKNGGINDYAPDAADPVCQTTTPEQSIVLGTSPGAGGFR
jgi:hypothetical protein